jgi:hypothetical protein
MKALKILGLIGLIGLSAASADAIEKKIQSSKVYTPKAQSSYSIKKSTIPYSVQKSTETKLSEKPLKNQLYLIAGQAMLNPEEYNKEIMNVSVSSSSQYGPASNIGIGYQRDFSKKVAGRLEISMNSQNKTAYKHDIPTNTDIPFGYNELVLYNIDPELVYTEHFGSSTCLEAGIGPAITVAKVTSANETEKGASTTAMIGGKLSLDLCKTLKDWFVKAGAELRTGKVETLDITAPAIRIKIGRRF